MQTFWMRILIFVILFLLAGITRIFAIELPVETNIKSEREAEEVVELDENSDLINRVADGIWRWKTVNGTIPWWHCGEGIESKKSIEKAREWSKTTISEANRIKDEHGYDFNIWGVLGTMSRESAFDECAIGPHTRFWAYENGLLKRKKRHITHSMDEIRSLINSEKWKKKWKWVDAGPGQLLWKRIYKGPLDDMLTIDPGINIVVTEMTNRLLYHIRFNKSLSKIRRLGLSDLKKRWWYSRPWSFWPYGGGKPSKKYAKKVQKRAYLLGATKGELSPLRMN